VSVLLACRGSVVPLLGEQLEGLARQDFTEPWELLIVDNGITDDLSPLLARYSTTIPWIRTIDATERPGRSYAMNLAVPQARSDRLITVDADDVVTPHYLSAMNEALQKHDFVGARLDSQALNPAWLHGRRAPLQADRLEQLTDHYQGVVGAGMAFTRAAFEKVNGFDEDMIALEDLDISFRLQRAGIHPVFTPTAVVRYRYRHSYRAIFRQERSYSRHEVLLHRKHRDTISPRGLQRTLGGWLAVLLAVRGVGTRIGRARLATKLGAAVGRIEGSARYRSWHL
jgi:GT2 family glycosyltransferase